MSNLFIWIILITIWHSILFYGKKIGISVLLFIIPLLILIYKTFNDKNKIKNKIGLITLIPIILLSMTYFIFNNSFFKILNFIVIPLLFALTYLFTMKPTFEISTIVSEIITLLFKPLTCITKTMNLFKKYLTYKLNISKETQKTIKSIIIITPLLLLIILLLTSADMIFDNIITKILDGLKEIFIINSFTNIIGRIFTGIIVFIYISTTMNYLLFDYKKEKREEKTCPETKDPHTIKLLLTVLNIIYLVFDVIQIKSLLLHSVSIGINYAEYARQGFFQLMIVSLINISILLISKKYEQTPKDKKYISIMNVILVLLTFIIIISSFFRMNLYEAMYGYTLLRLLVYITLFTETILLVPTIMYIFNSNFNISKHYMIIIITVYTIINFINIDAIITKRNIERYYEKDDIDIVYLKRLSTDNINQLIELYENTEDREIKNSLKLHFKIIDDSINSPQEFNLSKYNSSKKIKELEKIKDRKVNN